MPRLLSLTAFVFLLSTFSASAQEVDLKAALRKAIEAHGGADNLAKFKAHTARFKGTMELMGKTVDVTGETSFQHPNKLRNVMNLDLGGMAIEVVTVYDGKKMWVSAAGKTMEIDDEKILDEVRGSLQAEGAGSLSDFLKEPYTLTVVGDVKVKDKEALGIRVSKKGQRDLNLFLDKKTHLIVKTETRNYDPMSGQEVTQEKYFQSYQDKAGLKMPKTVEVLKDGKPFTTLEITEVDVLEKFDPSVFAKP